MIIFNLPISRVNEPIADEIGFYVQAHGGYFFVRRHVVEFHIDRRFKDFMLILYPFLEEEPMIL